MTDLTDGLLALREPIAYASVLSDLRPRLHEAIVAPARAVGRDLAVLGLSDMPRAQACWERADGSWVFASDYRHDPTFRDCGGKIAMPREELRAFDALAAAGLDCDLIWIVHELPATWRPRTRLPVIPDPPQARRRARGVLRFIDDLDPVVVGGLVHEQSGAVLWIELSRWVWE